MIKNLGVQLFTIRAFMGDPDFADVAFGKLKDLGYTEAHTAGNAFDAKLFGDLLQKHGIKIIGTHYDWNKIVNSPEETMEIHRMWGTTTVGTGSMPMPPRTNLDELKKYIDEFNRVAEIYAKEGFRLSYHNHHFEFVRIDGYKTVMDYLYEGLDPYTTSFVLDTYWCQHGGIDVRAMIERLAGRIDSLHIKDMEAAVPYKLEDGTTISAPKITEVGNGNINFKDIIPLAEKCGAKYFVVEDDRAPTTGDSMGAVKKAADYIKANLIEK